MIRSVIYDWLFSDGWLDYDNAPEGAAKRILYMLEHGVPDFKKDFKKLMPEYKLSIKRKNKKAGT